MRRWTARGLYLRDNRRVYSLLSSGESYGTRYEAARRAVEGHAKGWSFAPLKFIATLASTLSGIPGGMFAPSLAVGAGIGNVIASCWGWGPSFS